MCRVKGAGAILTKDRAAVEKAAKAKKRGKAKAHAAGGDLAGAAPLAAAKGAKADGRGKKSGFTASEIEALQQKNAQLQAELDAANGRAQHLIGLTQDVTKKLDGVIALLRGLVKP